MFLMQWLSVASLNTENMFQILNAASRWYGALTDLEHRLDSMKGVESKLRCFPPYCRLSVHFPSIAPHALACLKVWETGKPHLEIGALKPAWPSKWRLRQTSFNLGNFQPWRSLFLNEQKFWSHSLQGSPLAFPLSPLWITCKRLSCLMSKIHCSNCRALLQERVQKRRETQGIRIWLPLRYVACLVDFVQIWWRLCERRVLESRADGEGDREKGRGNLCGIENRSIGIERKSERVRRRE